MTERRADYLALPDIIERAIKPLKDDIARVETKLDAIGATLNGTDDQPGLKTRVAILETKIVVPLWIAAIAGSTVITALVGRALGAW